MASLRLALALINRLGTGLPHRVNSSAVAISRLSVDPMIHNHNESSTPARGRKVERGPLPDTTTVVTSLKKQEDPPLYGAQHRQNALWKGGNEALPPLWKEFKVLGNQTRYEDNTLYMGSWCRPLPGVRLDQPEDLIPGCEWHISPLGRSYFVNHNTQTTSWKKPTPERPAGCLMPERVIQGHSKCIWSLSCLDSNCNILSTSEDGSIRQWTRYGKVVGKPWNSDGEAVGSVAVSPDESMVVSGSANGTIRLWNMRDGSVVGEPWKGHKTVVRCLDWSHNALEIASGSEDGTVRRWNPNTGRQVSPAIETGHSWVYTVRYSPQGDKFASGGMDKVVRVWSKDGELLIEIKGHERALTSVCWSKDGTHIFSASSDSSIRKWNINNGRELFVLRGHTSAVRSLYLSSDERHLVSAAKDYSVRVWDLAINQPTGNLLLHDDELWALAISHNGKWIFSAGLDAKVYVWSMEAALKQQSGQSTNNSNTQRDAIPRVHTISRDILDVSTPSKQQTNKKGLSRYGDDFWGTGTHDTNHHSDPPVDPPTPPRRRSIFDFLRFSSRSETMPRPTSHQSQHSRNFTFFPWRFLTPPRNNDVSGDVTLCSATPVPIITERANGNKVVSSKQGKAAAGTRKVIVPGRPMNETTGQGQLAAAEIEGSYVFGCCGFHFVRRGSE